jgi:uncharacterized protein YggT (Ycf19 family)
MSEYKEVQTTQHEQGREQRITTFKVTQLIWLLLAILEVVIGLRFIFKLVGVNSANPFAAFIYSLTNFFVAPFASLTGAPAAAGMVFEFSTLIAMVIYALVGWGIVRIVYVSFYRPRGAVSASQTITTGHTGSTPPGSL